MLIAPEKPTLPQDPIRFAHSRTFFAPWMSQVCVDLLKSSRYDKLLQGMDGSFRSIDSSIIYLTTLVIFYVAMLTYQRLEGNPLAPTIQREKHIRLCWIHEIMVLLVLSFDCFPGLLIMSNSILYMICDWLCGDTYVHIYLHDHMRFERRKVQDCSIIISSWNGFSKKHTTSDIPW